MFHRVEFSFGVQDGRAVVLERRPDFPLILHVFDEAEEAVRFYESHRSEPLDSKRRAELLALAEQHAEVIQ